MRYDTVVDIETLGNKSNSTIKTIDKRYSLMI